MRYLLGFLLALLPILSNAQQEPDIPELPDTLVDIKYELVSVDHSLGVIISKNDTTFLNVRKGLDKQIDIAFRPIADFVGAIIFKSVNFGSVNQNSEFKVTKEEIASAGGALYLGFNDFKVNESKSVKSFSIIKGDAEIKSVDGQDYLVITSPGRIKLAITGTYFSVPLVLIILILGALFFTIFFKFANFTLIRTAVKIVKGDYDKIDDHISDNIEGDSTPGGDVFETIGVEAEGEVSHFQALTAALSATVGLGNIAGVAVAISLGGPGATFWMILAGFLGMATKFT